MGLLVRFIQTCTLKLKHLSPRNDVGVMDLFRNKVGFHPPCIKRQMSGSTSFNASVRTGFRMLNRSGQIMSTAQLFGG